MLLAYWLRQEIGRRMFQDRDRTMGEETGWRQRIRPQTQRKMFACN